MECMLENTQLCRVFMLRTVSAEQLDQIGESTQSAHKTRKWDAMEASKVLMLSSSK